MLNKRAFDLKLCQRPRKSLPLRGDDRTGCSRFDLRAVHRLWAPAPSEHPSGRPAEPDAARPVSPQRETTRTSFLNRIYLNKPVHLTRLLYTVILCGILLFASACSVINELANSIQKPSLSVTDVRVTGFSFSDIELTYDVTVNNPNAVSMQLMSYDYDLEINNSPFVNGNQDEQSRIEASGESTFQVPMTLNFQDLYSTITGLAGQDEADYAFSSTFAFDLPGLGRTEVPVNKKGTLPLVRMPDISVRNLEVSELSFTKATLALNLDFENPNGFGLNIQGFDYDLDVDGSQWAEGKALESVSIAEKETTQLQIPLTLNIAQMGTSVYRMLTGTSQTDYELNGTFTVGTTHPLLGQTSFNFNRKGQITVSRE